MTLDLTFEQALAHSFERLTLMCVEKRRQSNGKILKLADLIVMGINGKPECWEQLRHDVLELIRDHA